MLAAIAALAAVLIAGSAAAAPATCPPGWTHPKSDLTTCSPCPANTFQSGDACNACAPGQISDPASTGCCSGAVYTSGQGLRCRLQNTYACAPGSAPSFSDGRGGACAPCRAGTYSYAMRDAKGNPTSLRGCWPCPSGETSKAGSTTCQQVAKPTPPSGPPICRGNTIINKDGTRCVACPPASAANADHTACVAVGPTGGPAAPVAPGLLESSPTLGPQGPASTGTPLGPRPGAR